MFSNKMMFGFGFNDATVKHMEKLHVFHNSVKNVILVMLAIVLVSLILVWKFPFFNFELLEWSSLEFAWTMIPACILFCMGVPSMIILYQEFPDYYTSFIYTMMAHQWYWSFLSLDQKEVDSFLIKDKNSPFRKLEVDNPLILPLKKGLHFYLSSADVIHSFAVPSLAIKVDAVPGRLKEFFVFPLNLGKFYGQCSEICGANHSYMPISVEIVPKVKLVYKEHKLVKFKEKFIYLTLFTFILNCISMILCVPFLTLFERKILSYSQNRKGPKKISLFALLQPMVDGVKLILKESGFTMKSKNFMFFLSPMMLFSLSMMSCFILVFEKSSFIFKKSMIFFFVVSSCKVFPLFFSGFSSKSKYSKLGSFRGAAQVLAYEVCAVVVILSPVILSKTFSSYNMWQKYMIIMVPFFFWIWVYCMLMETKRTPFDFAEGESELVSGFKTEYSGLKFTFLFLAEYSNIMLMSIFSSMIFFSKSLFLSLIMIFFFLWARTSFPRFRYDFLMIFSWKVVLKISLIFLFFFFKIL